MTRVRIAPSPTGYMHVGTARTALFNWLFAKKNRGVFVLRIEDTDQERSTKEYEKNILDGLEWLGLDYEEGPIRQSERGELYQGCIERLLESGDAFYCQHSREELEKEREAQIVKKEAPRHVCDRKSNVAQGSNGALSVIRLRNPGGKVFFKDIIRGEIEFDAKLLGDFSIARSAGSALYNFAAAVDDADMKISHVIRGEDHISNTPKQILIQKALGFDSPQFAHLPLILGMDKSKLSKRHGATSLFAYKEMGYLPDAMFNFLAFLGWNPASAKAAAGKLGEGKEILSRAEILKWFLLEDIQKSGAVFNIDKLDWMNGEYIREMSITRLTESVREYLPQDTDLDIKKIIALEQNRLARLSDVREATEFFFKETIEYDLQLLKWKDMSDTELTDILGKLEQLLENISEKDYVKEKLEKIIMPKAEEWGKEGEKIDRGKTLWPLRVALSGRKASPGPFEIMEILGKQKCLARLREARDYTNYS